MRSKPESFKDLVTISETPPFNTYGGKPLDYELLNKHGIHVTMFELPKK